MQKEKRSTFRGHLALLTAGMMWGGMSPLAKYVMQAGSIPSVAVTTFRIVGAMGLFWLLSWIFPTQPVERKDYFRLFLAAFFAVLLNQGSFVVGVSLTSPVDASIITTTMPLITMTLAAIFLGEPISGMKATGVGLGMLGALLLIFNSAQGTHALNVSSPTHLLGDLLCFAAQCSYSIYLIFFQDLIKKYSPATLMKWVFSFASLIILPLSWSSLVEIPWQAVDSRQWAALAFVVVGGTFITYLLVPIGQKVLRPTITAMYNYMQPITASVLAVAWGMDSFSWSKLCAVLLIFSGVVFVNRSKRKADLPLPQK